MRRRTVGSVRCLVMSIRKLLVVLWDVRAIDGRLASEYSSVPGDNQ
jgi:hypothetical protein